MIKKDITSHTQVRINYIGIVVHNAVLWFSLPAVLSLYSVSMNYSLNSLN